MNDILVKLHTGLRARRTPESVLADIVAAGLHENLPHRARKQVDALVDKHDRCIGYTGMPETYRRHPGLERAHRAAEAAMRKITDTVGIGPLPAADAQDPESLRKFVLAALDVLRLPNDANPPRRRSGARVRTTTDTWIDFGGHTHTHTWTMRAGSRGRRGDRAGHANPRGALSAAQRREQLPGVSVRSYRRGVASVTHLQQRTEVLAAERDREAATAFGKSRLAYTIGLEEFVVSPATAAFVAYYVARLGLRTTFTNGPQDRPMDDIAEALLTEVYADSDARFDVVAKVLTRQKVLDRLTETQKGELLGCYYENLVCFSRSLERAFDRNRDRTKMVARRGDDSSTWNSASRAFNQARTGWLNLTEAMGLGHAVEAACPGKVPALVAADVAYWHTLSGGDQHADTQVFAELPLPWDVILHGDACPAEEVRRVCAKHGVDSDASGWTSAYRQSALAQSKPTPELVHGVEVSSPVLAQVLRTAGVFAGRAEISAPAVTA